MEITLGDLIKTASAPYGMPRALSILKDMEEDECPAGLDNLLAEDMALPLMPYQYSDALFHALVKKSFNLSDPGLGKTAVSIGYLTLLQKLMRRDVKSVSVTPSATVYQWSSEIEKFNPGFKPFIAEGDKKKRSKVYTDFADYNGSAVLIFNYQKILHDGSAIEGACEYADTIILDEVTCLKDMKSRQHAAFRSLCRGFDRSLLLTATPISSNLEEFYALLELVGMDGCIAPSYESFTEQFLVTQPMKVKGKWGGTFSINRVTGSKNVEVFESKMRNLYIRHENNTAAFAGLKLNIIKEPVRVTRTQADLIKKIAVKLRKEMETEKSVKSEIKKPDKDTYSPLMAYQDFSKVCMDPSIYDENALPFSPKIEKLVEFLKQNRDSKYVVYARFLSFHRLVHRRLLSEGIPFVSLTGAESAKQKEESKTEFVNNPAEKTQVILLTDAGKFGLNLQNANKIILMDIPYTPSNALQIIGRVFRTGQTSDVEAVFIYCEDTLEENQFHKLEERQESVDKFFSTDKSEMFALREKDMFGSKRMKKSLLELSDVPPPYTPTPDVLLAECDGYV